MPKYKTISASIQSEKDKLIYDYLMENPMISNSKLIKQALNYYLSHKIYNHDIVNNKPKDNISESGHISVTSDAKSMINDARKETKVNKTESPKKIHKEDKNHDHEDDYEDDYSLEFDGDVNINDEDNVSNFTGDAYEGFVTKG